MDITIHVPEMDKLTAAIEALAVAVPSALSATLVGKNETGEAKQNPTPAKTPAPNAPQKFMASAPASAAPAAAPTAPTSQTPNSFIAPQSSPAVAPVAAAPSYSLEQIARAAGSVADAGKRQEVCDLITKTFGAATLSQIPKDKYGAFATALRGLGARI